jgi:hypothetical protein
MIEMPKIDKRLAPEFARDVLRLLPAYVDNWPARGEEGEYAIALVNVFARYSEIIVNRLNRAPEKNFLAFLDLLGILPIPMQSARVPITFSLAPGSVDSVVVPQGTQVAAPPGKGEDRPVIFETELELIVSPVNLESLLMKDGARDQYSDFSSRVIPPSDSSPDEGGDGSSPGALLAQGKTQVIPHALLIGVKAYPVWPAANTVRLKFVLDKEPAISQDPQLVQWELCSAPASTPPLQPGGTPATWEQDCFITTALTPLVDGTENLTKSGEVVFLNLPLFSEVMVERLSSHWLRGRLLTPIADSLTARVGMVRESQLPLVKALTVSISIEKKGLTPDQLFFNNQKLDASKDFFPFGERPRFGDTLYIASLEAFSNPDALLTLHINLTNPRGRIDSPIPPVGPQGIKLNWEFWDGTQWGTLVSTEPVTLGEPAGRVKIYTEGATAPEPSDGQLSDKVQTFSADGEVRFRFGKPPAELNVNGVKNYWIRVRIIAGNYGREAHYEGEHGKNTFVAHPSTLAPPSIQSIDIDYKIDCEEPPQAVLTCNDFAYSRVPLEGSSFKPFLKTAPEDALPAIYLGFLPPSPPTTASAARSQFVLTSARKFPTRSMSIYVSLAKSTEVQSAESVAEALVAVWEYWDGFKWAKWTVRDGTQGLQRSGLIRFLAPTNFSSTKEFGRERYWLRMRQSDALFAPKLRRVLLNTTAAIEGSTIRSEILGSSTGKPHQKLRTTQAPVLEGQWLEVREATAPPLNEIKIIEESEGHDAISRVEALTAKGSEFWVRWHERPNFYSSEPRSRHYVLDRTSGQVLFGDDVHGMIPPVLPGNIRMRSYRTGGGARGNMPDQTIKQLKTAVPGIQKVMNCEPAVGGTDMEPTSSLFERGPRAVRHGDRAVTSEDYEDLALLASRDVARANCVPHYDLANDPDAKHRRPGAVSLIVVPRATNPKPVPDSDLISRVRSFLEARRVPTVSNSDLIVVGPEYVGVNVEVEIAAEDPEIANEVELQVKRALDRYLHPVTGGPEGSGWGFGRNPHRSDLFKLIEGIPGVSHVRELHMKLIPDREGAEETGRSLVCCGTHSVTTTLEE